MASKRFKKVFAVRFVAYLLLFVAIISVSFQIGPVIVVEFNYRRDQLLQVRYSVENTAASTNGPSNSNSNSGNIFGVNQLSINPVSTDYGIVIEKINANAKIIPDVDPGNERQYAQALALGVAAAAGSTLPGEPGNLYVFSHSTDAPWNIARFNAIFYLLRELAPGDRILIFYKNKRYDYVVYDKQVVSPRDVSFLTNRYPDPTLTLQTCDPPGTLANRLIVRARLARR